MWKCGEYPWIFLYCSEVKMEICMRKIRSQHRRIYVRVPGTVLMLGTVIATCDASNPKAEVGGLQENLWKLTGQQICLSNRKEQETLSQTKPVNQVCPLALTPCVVCACHHTQSH